MSGYLVDRLTFCTQTSDPGVTFGSACPAFKPTPSCLWMAEYTFWATASRNVNSFNPNTAEGEAGAESGRGWSREWERLEQRVREAGAESDRGWSRE